MTHSYNTAQDWINACLRHGCRLHSTDQPSMRRIGYACFDCDDSFSIGLADFKSTQGKLTQGERDMLRTAMGRIRLAESWYSTLWCVVIEDEVDWDD